MRDSVSLPLLVKGAPTEALHPRMHCGSYVSIGWGRALLRLRGGGVRVLWRCCYNTAYMILLCAAFVLLRHVLMYQGLILESGTPCLPFPGTKITGIYHHAHTWEFCIFSRLLRQWGCRHWESKKEKNIFYLAILQTIGGGSRFWGLDPFSEGRNGPMSYVFLFSRHR